MAKQEDREATELELLRAIVQEVQGARDTLELVQQFVPALPIRSFDDIVAALGEQNAVRFRGAQFDVRAFAHLVPDVLFPIDSMQKLISLAAIAVESIPGTAGNELSDPELARSFIRRASLRSFAPAGRLGPAPGAASFQSSHSMPLSSGFGGGSLGRTPQSREEGK